MLKDKVVKLFERDFPGEWGVSTVGDPQGPTKPGQLKRADEPVQPEYQIVDLNDLKNVENRLYAMGIYMYEMPDSGSDLWFIISKSRLTSRQIKQIAEDSLAQD